MKTFIFILVAIACILNIANAANPRFKEVETKITKPTPSKIGRCMLMEEMKPFGCSMNKFHGTVLKGHNVSEVKRAQSYPK